MEIKIFIQNKEQGIENIGAIFLSPNQYKYYKNYFLILFSPWQNYPKEKYIKELEHFISKYYKKSLYIYLFKKSIERNKLYLKNLQNNIYKIK